MIMKERPILFTPENAQKVRDGVKTQTRRIMKPQPVRINGSAVIKCPYGKIKERLWVAIDDPGKWRSSLYMPRWACRTVVELTNVRVERLNDISDEDAKAEGVDVKPDAEIAARVAGPPETGARMEYFALWESIYGKGAWSLNPWVWVLTFRKIES